MKTFDFRHRQKVSEPELEAFQLAIENFTKQLTKDYFSGGFTEYPLLVQNDPTPNFTVDVKPLVNHSITGRDKNGERIYIPTKQDVSLAALGVTLPASGNEKYVTILVGYDKAESDSRPDPVTTIPFNYVLDDGFEFTAIEGAEALAGSAIKPSDPDDGRIIIGDILLTDSSTSILDSMIDQERMPRSLLAEFVSGTINKEWNINANSFGTPPTLDEQYLFFKRGNKPPVGFRMTEGVDPELDAPTLSFTKFTSSTSFSWQTGIDDQSAAEVPTATFNGLFASATNTQEALDIADNFVLGEINTASNRPGGFGVFKTKVGNDLQFKSLVEGSNITLIPGVDTITINSSGGGGGGGTDLRVENFTTDGIATVGGLKYVDLTDVPGNPAYVVVLVRTGSSQVVVVDFEIITDGSDLKRLSWDGFITGGSENIDGMEEALTNGGPGTKFTVIYGTGSASTNLGELRRLSTTPITDATVIGDTTLFTTTATKTMVKFAVIELTAGTGIGGTPEAGIGTNATEDNIFYSEPMPNLTAIKKNHVFDLFGGGEMFDAATVIKFGLDVPLSGTGVTLDVHLYGIEL